MFHRVSAEMASLRNCRMVPRLLDAGCRRTVRQRSADGRAGGAIPRVSLVSRGDPLHAGAVDRRPADIGQGGRFGWSRFVSVVGAVTPGRVPSPGAEGLEGCGFVEAQDRISADLAGHFSVDNWRQCLGQHDEAIIAELVAVRGIGRWTAEMFLIFNQMRPDVFPLDDIGLQRAIFLRYFNGEKQPRSVFGGFGERWRPGVRWPPGIVAQPRSGAGGVLIRLPAFGVKCAPTKKTSSP